MVTRENSFSVDRESLMIWAEDKANHSIPISRHVMQSKALILNSLRTKKRKEAAEETLEAR